MPQRTRVQGSLVDYPGQAKQQIELGTVPNSLRLFNRPTSVDVRGTGTIIRSGTQLPAAFGTNLIGRLGKVSTMTDVTGNKTGFNNVNHTVEHYECPLRVITCKTRCNPPHGGATIVTSEFNIGAALGCALNLTAVPFMGTDADRRAECLSQMNPRVINPAFDASQFVGEMLEGVKTLVSGVAQIDDFVKEMNRLNRWNSPAVRRLMGQKTLQDLSLKNWLDLGVAANLSWSLAIRPMLEAWKQAKAARESYKRVLERVVSETVTLHGRSIRQQVVDSTPNGNDYHKWGNTRTIKSEVYCTAEVQYHSLLTDALKDEVFDAHMGLTPSAATVYELLPLSFILDWVWNFGRFLSRNLQRPIDDISYTVLRTCWSRKVSTRSEGWVEVCQGVYGVSIKDLAKPAGLITGTATRTTYLRESIPLNLEAGVVPAPTINMPSAGQISTLLSLLWALATSRQAFLRIAQRGQT